MKVKELVAALAGFDPEQDVHVAVELGEVDSVSFHHIQEIEGCGIGCSHGVGAEIIVYEAGEIYCGPPDLSAVLLGNAS